MAGMVFGPGINSRQKRLVFGCLLACACVLMLWLPAWSDAGANDIPKPEAGGWVSDIAEVISPEGEEEINSMAQGLHQKNGSKFYVVTTPRLPAGETEVQLAERLLNDWTRSCRSTDQGMLVLLAVEDRRLGWRTGAIPRKCLVM